MAEKSFKILLISHDQLAKGLLSSIKFFITEVENVAAIAAFSEITHVKEAIVDWLTQNSDYDRLIVTDIVGGSINQTAFKLLKEHDFYLVSGMNLALLLEIMFMDKITEESLSLAVSNAKDQIILMNSVSIETEEEEF